MKKIMVIILLFIISGLLSYFFFENGDFIKRGKLYINEIVASNNYTYPTKNGEYYDYIELYNGNDYPIDLTDYRLGDSIAEINKWHFPNITIDAKEYLIVYASKKNICEEKDDCHTNFKLSSTGENLLLTDNNGNIISRVRYPSLSNDTSFSYVKNKYQVTLPTPKKENTEKAIKDEIIQSGSIIINEYMSHNKSSVYTNNGGYYDWVELYNTTDKDIDLFGVSLSDDEKDLTKFRFPKTSLKAKEYLVIYLTGGVNIDNLICANFKLSDNDKKIILSSNNKIIDSVNVIPLKENVSYGKKDDKWVYFYTPTPGSENTTSGITGESE